MSSKTQELLKLARKIAEKTPEERLEEIQELSNRGKEAAIARFNMEDVLFDKQLEAYYSQSNKKVLVCSRRCLAAGTLVKTANRGLVKIEEVTTNDLVFGVEADGSVKPCGVSEVHSNGVRPTVVLSYGSEKIEATRDHVFQTKYIYKHSETVMEIPVEKITSRHKIVRKFPTDTEGGPKDAYLIGYVQGNGCMTCCTTNQLVVSSDEEACVSRCADVLGCGYKKASGANYNWFVLAGKEKLESIYNRFRGEKSFEKHILYSEVCTWGTEAKLELLAGMLDSDGCIHPGDGGISLAFGCQSKQTVETFMMLCTELFNTHMRLNCDNRGKYKNGPVYYARVKSSSKIKTIMRRLEGRTQRVKMRPEWWDFPEQRIEDRAGFYITSESLAETYDLSIANSTNLYLLGNGCVTHNSGKSTYIAAELLITAMENPRTTQMYVGLTKASARMSMEDALVQFIADYQLPCKFNKNTMRIDFQNGSKILIEGAKDGAAVERLRGGKLLKAVVDEAQSFPTAFALNLISSVIEPALGDLGGTLIISGTPDPLCKSVLYRAFKGVAPFENFDKFSWNTTQNKKFPLFVMGKSTPEQYLQDKLKSTGYKETDPAFRREYLGEFVEDRESLAYGFDPDRDLAPELPKGHEWNYVVSFDAGFVDSDAIVCMAFSYTCRVAYVVECYSMAKQDISSLMDKVVYFQQKYDPIKVIGDPAGGGAKMVSELNNRYGISAKVAEKFNPKILGVKLVGSDFRAGFLKVVDCEENDLLIAQLSSITIKVKQDRQGNFVQYVPDGKCVVNEDGVIGDDCADAMLYAFKFCRNHYSKERYDESPQEQVLRIISEHKQEIADRDIAEAYAERERSWF